MNTILFTNSLFSQTGASWLCGDDKILSLQRQLSPNYEQQNQDNNFALNNYIKQKFLKKVDSTSGRSDVAILGTGLPDDSIYTIPVVVHVIYPPGEAYGSSNNISYAQIRSQIEALNAAFSKSY
ncbi:MAG: hypothetical protein H7101_12035, partial [Deinococcales bacterium]|nr:hypothetical protein [Chitinophagaceae bacterium]